ncbi:hypothetical protein AXG93_1707s1000 [Marchantia polymorpha subsp. ruderalis]|uniref:C-terminal of Roc (COR) domain-containing protein n=1 Tax=Marchantia polymorpha subsp. ruderalis TaxID=1480154 RepID=A0A176W3E9_MARPO|nr:hypothetical protein AXG93_1707s1000 [Marchantia polymorpha subsp. ruderalis]
MGLLQKNLTLRAIEVSGTSWQTDGKAALIQQALEQNRKRAEYMAVFREARLAFGDAKVGRLFLCGSPLAEFIPPSSSYSLDRSSMMSSIKSYLNDVGSIVHIPNLDYIIVNPNWLTNTLLGELIAFGQNFQAQDSESSDRWSSYTSKDGFVSESVFARLIEEFLEKQPHGQRSVDREVLENILINLDLCFKLEDTCQYFTPSFIPGHASMEEGSAGESMVSETITEHASMEEESAVQSMAWKTWNETSKFAGMRIQCQDARTMSLTAAFFPCFQMFMRRKLISEMGVPKEKVTCSRHYLCLFFGGHQIYVQEGTSHKYVDVLMLCSEDKSREDALKDVKKHIIQELISFCASPKGCPGVALVLGAIQTLCVEMLIPSHRRGAILIEELKSKFIHKAEGLPLLDLKFEEEFFNYEHSWPLIEGHTTEVVYEKAMDLLCESDVEAVLNEIRHKTMQQLYVTNDVGLFYGVNASVHYGESVRLHWMCQSRTGFHMIKDQEGLSIRVDRWNSSCIWKIIEISSKFIYDAAKAGLDVTSGVGEAIPDRGDLKSDIVKLDGISDSDSRTELKGGESMELKEAWLRIQQTIAPQLRNRYSTIFKLYQVKYVRLELGGHAWVCEECLNKGFRSGILTC